MPAAVLPPQPLADTTNTRHKLQTPSAGKKRRHDGSPVNSQSTPRQIKANGPGIGSSQPKSHFEEEVLEKLTQDISGLKKKNAEKDQQWARPSLDDFDEQTDNLCFQQIDAEEGTLHGGKATVKLYGTSEVWPLLEARCR